MEMDKNKKEHKCWYCMTDIEKNEWLESEGFGIRYPIEFAMPETKWYFNGHRFTSISELEAEIRLASCHNPRELIPIGF